MNNVAQCSNFEILFSKDAAILSFSCEDIGRDDADMEDPSQEQASGKPVVIPGKPSGASWSASGWDVDFEQADGAPDRICFTGVPESVLARVAQHPRLLVVGLTRGPTAMAPNISLSSELDLPARSPQAA